MAKVFFEKPELPGFFSVKRTYSIAGVKFRPSVCYPVYEVIRGAIEALAKDGNAALYDEEQVFINGIPTKKSTMTDRPMGTQLTPGNAEWHHPGDDKVAATIEIGGLEGKPL
jgi:hypothetical protein